MMTILESNSRQSLFGDAISSVIKAADAGRVLRVDAEVTRLLDAHPACPMGRDELTDYIMNFAANVRASIEVGANAAAGDPAYLDGLIDAFHRYRVRPPAEVQADGVSAVGLEDAHRPHRPDAVAVQEDHDLPDH